MKLTESEINGINTALNESTLLGAEFDPERNLTAITFEVLTLPPEGPPPQDRKVQFLIHSVSRIAASLKKGRWDDPDAEIISFGIEKLLDVIQSFGGQPIYGWDFFGIPGKKDIKWLNQLSLDHRTEIQSADYFLELFQEDDRHLDICFWFQIFQIRGSSGKEIPLNEFIAGGKRWWDGLYSGDSRARGYGISPLK